jgi:hypothetical protein
MSTPTKVAAATLQQATESLRRAEERLSNFMNANSTDFASTGKSLLVEQEKKELSKYWWNTANSKQLKSLLKETCFSTAHLHLPPFITFYPFF